MTAVYTGLNSCYLLALVSIDTLISLQMIILVLFNCFIVYTLTS